MHNFGDSLELRMHRWLANRPSRVLLRSRLVHANRESGAVWFACGTDPAESISEPEHDSRLCDVDSSHRLVGARRAGSGLSFRADGCRNGAPKWVLK